MWTLLQISLMLQDLLLLPRELREQPKSRSDLDKCNSLWTHTRAHWVMGSKGHYRSLTRGWSTDRNYSWLRNSSSRQRALLIGLKLFKPYLTKDPHKYRLVNQCFNNLRIKAQVTKATGASTSTIFTPRATQQISFSQLVATVRKTFTPTQAACSRCNPQLA